MPMWSPSRSSLCLINLSRSRLFTHNGLSNLVANCTKLVEIDLSNWTELTNTATMAIAKAKNLEMRWVFLREIVFQMFVTSVLKLNMVLDLPMLSHRNNG
ncbi:F-box/LRR-repeat protein 3-like [Fagus crenata]